MATSIFISGDNNINHAEDQEDQCHHHHHPIPIRRTVSGRRKPKAASGATGEDKKKKPPQRGMGVARLERLRVEENLKMISESKNKLYTCFNNINQIPPIISGFNPNYQTSTYLGFHGSSDYFGNNAVHSSLIQNPFNYSISQQSINPPCHNKKKKINNGENHTNRIPPFVPLCAPKVGSTQSGVEVVAIHRKGSEGENNNDRVVMEYEFFPGVKKENRLDFNEEDDDDDELLMTMMMASREGSSTSTSCVGFDAYSTSSTSCIDLSLKL